MTPGRRLRCSLGKEFRALAVPWLACLATLLAAAALGPGHFLGLALPAYAVGAIALGALSVGHEYSHRTLGLLLSLPVRRERLFLEKMGVLAVQLLMLFGAAALMMRDTGALQDGGIRSLERTALVVLPVLCGFFIAPWLTLLCRNAVAGTVFGIALPGLLLVVGEMVGVLLYDSRSAASEFRLMVVAVGVLAACAIGTVSSWRLFRRLEAVEQRGDAVRLPGFRRSPAASAGVRSMRHPAWRLVSKEVRLQQMPLALGALYLLAWVALAVVTRGFPLVMDTFSAVTVFYCAFIALLIGCLAFADERQNGTLECQLLLPMAAWKPWAVKVGVALGLALVLGIGLPALVLRGTQLLAAGPTHEPIGRWMLGFPAVVLTVGGLYVSSLSRTGLLALLMSIPAVAGMGLFVALLERPLTRAAWGFVSYVPDSMILPRFVATPLMGMVPQLSLLFAIGVLALMLRFGYVNYRSADLPRSRAVKQVLGLAAVITIAIVVVSAVSAWSFASHHRVRAPSRRQPVRQSLEGPTGACGGAVVTDQSGRAGLLRSTPS